MRTLEVAFAVSIFCGGTGAVGQISAAVNDPAEMKIPDPGSLTNFDRSKPSSDHHRDFVRNLTIESFGYSLAPQGEGFEFSPGYTSAFFNLHGLECPRCLIGPVNRTKFTLPPFGADGTLKLAGDRIELLTGIGALEAWKPDNTFEPQGHRMGASSYGDAWLAQAKGGARFAIDRDRRLWLGGTGRSLYRFGSGFKVGAEKSRWNTFSGGATFTFGH